MIEQPHITEHEAQLTAIIRFTIPRSEIVKVMGPGIDELMETVRAQGIGPAGRWYSLHHRMDPATFDFEIGVPVSAPVTPTGRVESGQLPAARVVRTVYHGGYEGLGAAWGELVPYCAAERLAIAPNLWEVYLVGPESGPDSAAYRTELSRPLL